MDRQKRLAPCQPCSLVLASSLDADHLAPCLAQGLPLLLLLFPFALSAEKLEGALPLLSLMNLAI
jgi:hypothetical protein